MNKPIRRVAVLGAGVMGAGIAAHIANAGLPVLLLDIVPPDIKDGAKKSERNAFAAGAVKKMLKSKPAAFFNKSHAALVEVGNLEDDLEKAAECDLIIEAIIERLDIKRGLFAKLQPLLGESILASNTSGLRIEDMLEGMNQEFKENFLVMHFFNPPRYMKLLELVAAPETSKETVARVEFFGKEKLGKGIVWAKDKPNFVANRVGTQSLMATVHLMIKEGLVPEDVDAITGVPMGHPKSATFRTVDLVGLDTLAHVVKNCHDVLVDDEDRELFETPSFISAMIEKKLLGGKTRQGFYKKSKAGIQTLDLETLEYREKGGDPDIKKACKKLNKIPKIEERLRATVATEGTIGKFSWTLLSRAMSYAARRVGEICDDIVAIDNGMCWGYNWELGPFQTWDALGFAETYDRMVKEGVSLPDSVKKMRESGATGFYKDGEVYDLLSGKYVPAVVDEREVSLTVLRRGESAVLSNAGAEAWDLGDGVLGLTFKSKSNSIDADVIGMLNDATEKAEQEFSSMVITNQGDNFCVGANLFLVVMAAGAGKWDELRGMVENYQAVTQRIKYSTIPVVAAPYGMTLGGGLELCFACDSVQAAAETYSGLVEVGVGLLPGGAGNMNMLWRALEGVPQGTDIDVSAFVAQTFKNIAMANVATSANEAKEFGYFRHSDGVSFDRSRQLWEAKQRAIGLAKSGYHAPVPRAYKLPGDSGIATIGMLIDSMRNGGFASEHDALISGKVAEVLCGGKGGASHKVTETEMLELEAEAFLSLCGEKKSQERMQHMLMKNKPLRN
ncbi:MAG: 3-hydroxyacyl-CoA dehydrogenase/enoyl-CoA hydratase family protein [Kofleriaceae bacterium]|nr:3-hydroxyacyl-CoA dehydrogenase/enoyl-CoA hydratase family protein [Kofleriaceae bacterium]